MKCPECKAEINPKLIAKEFASKGGKVVSKRKSVTAKINGKKGGRPNGRKGGRPLKKKES